MKPLPPRDPITAHKQAQVAQRRVGIGARCACGESRPEALAAGKRPVLCAACIRRRDGKSAVDHHHIAGKPNSPITISVPVNDHRAELTVAQRDWPPETRENPDRSPVLAAAAGIRGFVDSVVYLIEHSILWIAEMLEMLERVLRAERGPGWWKTTEVERYAPKA